MFLFVGFHCNPKTNQILKLLDYWVSTVSKADKIAQQLDVKNVKSGFLVHCHQYSLIFQGSRLGCKSFAAVSEGRPSSEGSAVSEHQGPGQKSVAQT